MTAVVVGRFLSRPDALSLLSPDRSGDVDSARAEVAELRTRLDGHYDQAVAGKLSAGGLAKMEARLLRQSGGRAPRYCCDRFTDAA